MHHHFIIAMDTETSGFIEKFQFYPFVKPCITIWDLDPWSQVLFGSKSELEWFFIQTASINFLNSSNEALFCVHFILFQNTGQNLKKTKIFASTSNQAIKFKNNEQNVNIFVVWSTLNVESSHK